jgi:hypothetical protein
MYETTNTTRPIVAASNMTFSNINPTSVQVNWTSGTGQGRVVQAAPGRRPTALAFDGVNDHVVVNYNAALQPTSAVTLECWVNRSNWNASVATQYYAGNAESGGYCFLHSGTYLYSYVYRNSAWGVNITDVTHLSSGWHHLAMTYDGRYIRTMIDGALYAINDAGANYPIAYTYSNAFIIGADVGTGSTTTGSYANCQIDEVRVWNIAQTQGMVAYYMNRECSGYEAGLAAYYRFNDGSASGNTASNSSLNINNINGILTNMTTAAATAYTAASGWVLQNSPVNIPADFTYYSGSTYYGNGVLIGNKPRSIINTAGNNVTVTNLTPGTYYYFVVSEYDENGAPFYNYWDGILMGEVQTAAGAVPTITNMSPTSGTVGTVVTLTGTGFSSTPNNNIVMFGATRAQVTAASATSLTVVAPYGATYAPVSVQVDGITGTYTREFIITSSCANTITASSFTNSTLTSGTSFETVIRDYDSDGKSDYISPSSAGWFYGNRGQSNNGANPPAFSFNVYSSVSGLYKCDMADLDNDGKQDAVFTSTGSNTLVVHTTLGGSFVLPANFQAPLPYQPKDVKIGDFDGDGKLDIAVAYGNTGTVISVLRNTGSVQNPQFASRSDFSVGAVANCLYVRDLDQDGKADILFGQTGLNQFGILRSSSTPGVISFDAQDNISTSATVNAITCGDFNNDGKADIAVALSNNTVRTYNNTSTSGNISTGTITFASSLNTLASGPMTIACADLDGDGTPARPEIIVGYSAVNTVSIFEGTGSFGFAARVDIATSGSASVHVAPGDFNQDGKMDIAIATSGTVMNILTNDMDPLASEPTSPSTNLTVSGQTQTSMTLNFTAGNGFNRLVAIKQGTSITNTPFDGAGYAANSIYGSGADLGGGTYVVYNGTGNSVTVTGLQSNTLYYLAVFEYNSNGSGCTNNYLLTPAATNGSTLNTPPTINPISNPTAICQNSSQQTINFSGVGSGSGTESQTLTVTATSNNLALIPNPSVTYTSPATSGSLSYTPVPGQYGSAVITVTVNDNAANNNITTTTFTVTVSQQPTTANAGPDQNICVTTATLAANTPTVGTGTWSVVTSNCGITTGNLGNVNTPNTTLNGLTAGCSVTLRWTITSGNCTPSFDDVVITRSTCPLTAAFTWSPSTICATPAQINNISFTDQSFAPSSTIIGWNWTFAGPTTPNPTSSTQQNPANIQFTGPGTFTVTLTINDNVGGNSSVTNYITINPYPSAAGVITGSATVCQGATLIPFSVGAIANATSYNWTLPLGASIASGSGTNNILVDFSAVASSGFIQVQGSNACGVGASSAPFNVTVLPLPGATSSISGPLTVCQGQTGVVFSTPGIANATSYNWTLPPGATITSSPNASTITVSFAPNATGGVVNVIGVNSCGNGSSSVGINISVNPLPNPAGSITGLTAVCEGTTGVIYSVSPIVAATSYNWTLPPGAVITAGSGTNSITVSFANATGSGNVSVAGVNSCGSGTSSALVVNVGLLPDSATAVSGPATVCAGASSVQYSVSSVSGSSSYNWTLPPGATIASNNGNVITVDFATNAQSGLITVNGSNACGAGPASVGVNLVVNPLPSSTGTVSGVTTVCQGQSGVVFSVPVANNAANYSWVLPLGAIVTGGDSTNSITVSFNTAAQSGPIYVMGNNSCGVGLATDTIQLTVNPLPDVAGVISGPTAVCEGTSGVVYSVSAITYATSYSWSVPPGAVITAGVGTNTITVDYTNATASGDVTVVGVNGCGNGLSSNLAITVNMLPDSATAISGPASVCAGATGVQYSVSSISGATSYNWTLPSGATIATNSGNVITVDFATNAVSGLITVNGVNTCGSGVASNGVNVVINPLPATTGTLTGVSTVCQGQSGVVFSVPVANNATNYGWVLPIGATVTAGDSTNSITVQFSTNAQSGPIYVVGNNSCGTGSASDTIQLVVNPLPAAAGTVSGTANIGICPAGTGVVFSLTPVNNASYYVWTLPSGATVVSGDSTNAITVDFVSTAASGSIVVYAENACGTGASSSYNYTMATVTPIDICMVTVDGPSQYNNVMWNKPTVTDIDSFRIYREITSNNYQIVGTVSYDSLSIFVDSVYVPFANPNATFQRYKISAVDSCGNESAISTHHRTLFMQASVGVSGEANLNWTMYEGQSVDYYRILRDSTLAGNWEVIDSVPGTNWVYTDWNVPTTVTQCRYRIQTVWQVSCSPTRNIVTSESNLEDLIVNGINDHSATFPVELYPNPTNAVVTIVTPGSSDGIIYEVMDATGRVVLAKKENSAGGSQQVTQLDLSGLANGAYTIVITAGDAKQREKVILQK